MSRRVRRQLRYRNLAAGWIRYIVRIQLTGITGRKRTEEIKDEHIEAFEKSTAKCLVGTYGRIGVRGKQAAS